MTSINNAILNGTTVLNGSLKLNSKTSGKPKNILQSNTNGFLMEGPKVSISPASNSIVQRNNNSDIIGTTKTQVLGDISKNLANTKFVNDSITSVVGPIQDQTDNLQMDVTALQTQVGDKPTGVSTLYVTHSNPTTAGGVPILPSYEGQIAVYNNTTTPGLPVTTLYIGVSNGATPTPALVWKSVSLL